MKVSELIDTYVEQHGDYTNTIDNPRRNSKGVMDWEDLGCWLAREHSINIPNLTSVAGARGLGGGQKYKVLYEAAMHTLKTGENPAWYYAEQSITHKLMAKDFPNSRNLYDFIERKL